MIRALLSIVLCGACLVTGLVTTHVQAENHALAARLDLIKRRCDLIEAGNESLEYAICVQRGRIEREATSEALEATTVEE